MFDRLIKLVRHEKVSLFIGAGFSIEASAPSVRQLKELILSGGVNDEQRKAHESDDLDDVLVVNYAKFDDVLQELR